MTLNQRTGLLIFIVSYVPFSLICYNAYFDKTEIPLWSIILLIFILFGLFTFIGEK